MGSGTAYVVAYFRKKSARSKTGRPIDVWAFERLDVASEETPTMTADYKNRSLYKWTVPGDYDEAQRQLRHRLATSPTFVSTMMQQAMKLGPKG